MDTVVRAASQLLRDELRDMLYCNIYDCGYKAIRLTHLAHACTVSAFFIRLPKPFQRMFYKVELAVTTLTSDEIRCMKGYLRKSTTLTADQAYLLMRMWYDRERHWSMRYQSFYTSATLYGFKTFLLSDPECFQQAAQAIVKLTRAV